MNRAIATVKAAFPAGSILADLTVTGCDEASIALKLVIDDSGDGYGANSLFVVVDAIWDAFAGENVRQHTDIEYSVASDASSTYSMST